MGSIESSGTVVASSPKRWNTNWLDVVAMHSSAQSEARTERLRTSLTTAWETGHPTSLVTRVSSMRPEELPFAGSTGKAG